MKYVGSTRLTREQVSLIRAMIEAFVDDHRYADIPATKEQAGKNLTDTMRLIESLPKHAPYDLALYPNEWAMLSKALRLNGTRPEPGTIDARAYALYQLLLRRGFKHPPKGES